MCQKMKIPPSPSDVSIAGINRISSKLNEWCTVQIKARHNNFTAKLQCFVLPSITEELPSVPMDTSTWEIRDDIPLADPNFNEPERIDLLTGAGLFWKLIMTGQTLLGKGKPILQRTKLGWVIAGYYGNGSPQSTTICNLSLNEELHQQIKRFWEIEEVPSRQARSKEEKACELHFQQHTQRQLNG